MIPGQDKMNRRLMAFAQQSRTKHFPRLKRAATDLRVDPWDGSAGNETFWMSQKEIPYERFEALP
jgi:hypothetical protein